MRNKQVLVRETIDFVRKANCDPEILVPISDETDGESFNITVHDFHFDGSTGYFILVGLREYNGPNPWLIIEGSAEIAHAPEGNLIYFPRQAQAVSWYHHMRLDNIPLPTRTPDPVPLE
jgi:hypothetical protein